MELAADNPPSLARSPVGLIPTLQMNVALDQWLDHQVFTLKVAGSNPARNSSFLCVAQAD